MNLHDARTHRIVLTQPKGTDERNMNHDLNLHRHMFACHVREDFSCSLRILCNFYLSY